MKEKVLTYSDYFLNYSITKAQSLFFPKESVHSTCDAVPAAIFRRTLCWYSDIHASEQEGSVSILLRHGFKSRSLKEDSICDQTLSKRALLAGWGLAGI